MPRLGRRSLAKTAAERCGEQREMYKDVMAGSERLRRGPVRGRQNLEKEASQFRRRPLGLAGGVVSGGGGGEEMVKWSENVPPEERT